MIMNSQQGQLRSATLEAHLDYYKEGGYPDDRLHWTVETFFQRENSGRLLEVGCGDGLLLRLISEKGLAVTGVDASMSGIEKCEKEGLHALCLDVSTEGLPFPDDSFDFVVSLETIEHLMNPYHALQEVRRVLSNNGRFLCSVPNPRTGHPYLYPGLFEYKNFRLFLEQSAFTIERVVPWQWAPRESILPRAFRGNAVLGSRWVAGSVRKFLEKSYLAVGKFPAFSYWLWNFDCRSQKSKDGDMFEAVSEQTRPGSKRRFRVGS